MVHHTGQGGLCIVVFGNHVSASLTHLDVVLLSFVVESSSSIFADLFQREMIHMWL